MRHFGVDAKIDQNIGHHSENIWWNAAIPFKDLDELVSEEFSKSFAVAWQKLRRRSPRFCPIAFQ